MTATDTDTDAIRAVTLLYLQGMVWGQADKLRMAFHPTATATGHFAGEYLSAGREAFIAEWLGLGPLPPGTPFECDIVMVDITGDVALVKVRDTCFGDDYTDCLTMIKIEGRWQITHKAWFVHPRAT
jgi:hypothetical protein